MESSHDNEMPLMAEDEGNFEEDLEAKAEAEIEAAIDVAIEAQREREAELEEELAADWEHDETEPSADPQIQLDYQAALGAFIVEFNRLDNQLTAVLRRALGHVKKLEQLPMYRQRGYGAKLQALELLQTNPAIPGIHRAPIHDMRKIGAIRNFLAHAHFDQNPFDGSYVLVPPRSDRVSEEAHLKSVAVGRWTTRISAACHELRGCEAPFWFASVKVPPLD